MTTKSTFFGLTKIPNIFILLNESLIQNVLKITKVNFSNLQITKKKIYFHALKTAKIVLAFGETRLFKKFGAHCAILIILNKLL